MQTRQLGNTGIVTSVLSFGTWQIGGARYGAIDAKFASQLLRQALTYGVNTFDMSNVYGNGRSEIIVGETFRDCRKDVVYITKCGYLTGVDGAQELLTTIPQFFNAEELLYSCEQSLKRLQTDYIDVFLLHDPSTSVLLGDEVWDTLKKLKQAGKVRSFGASTSPRKAKIAVEKGAEVVEVLFNVLRPEATNYVFPLVHEHNIGVLARSPFANGQLFQVPSVSNKLLTEFPSSTLVQTAIQFCLGYKEVASLVTGIMAGQELSENISCLTPGSYFNSEQLTRLSNLFIQSSDGP